jgi:hypothetical protein
MTQKSLEIFLQSKSCETNHSLLKTISSIDFYLSVFQRTLWTIILLMAFILIILAGPSYCALLVLLLTIGIIYTIKEYDRVLINIINFSKNYYNNTMTYIY